MILHLVDNGTASLIMGLNSLSNFITKPSNGEVEFYSELKFAVFGIHNAIELYSKKLLSNIDDLLIYDSKLLDDKDVLKYMGRRRTRGKHVNLDYYLVTRNKDFATIGFQKCVERLNSCYELDKGYVLNLYALNRYRNILMHFGIEDYFSTHGILVALKHSLDMLYKFYYPRINKNKELIHESYYDRIIDVLDSLHPFISENWEALYGIELRQSFEIIKNLMTTEYSQEVFGEVIMDMEGYDPYEFWVIFYGDEINEIHLEYLPAVDAAIVYSGTDTLFLIDYKNFTTFEDGIEVVIFNEVHEIDYCFDLKWREWDDKKHKKYCKLKLNDRSFCKNFKERILL